MDESLNARLHFDDAGNIVADTTQGQILIVRRAQRKNSFDYGTDSAELSDDTGVPAGGRGAHGGGGAADANGRMNG